MMTKLGRSSSKEGINNSDETVSNLDQTRKIADQLKRLEDNDPNLATCVQFTKQHPLGAILFKLAQDNTLLAGEKGLVTNISDLCTSFHTAIQIQKSDMDEKLLQSHDEIQQALIHKDLNSHQINTNIKPPDYFSPIPTITTPQKLTEILKVFPRGNKFSGSNQESQISVVEFLNTLKTAQSQCRLSEKEFVDRMLEASTGLAHELILEWRNNNESIATIYHNLLINFDKRMTPNEAKIKLSAFTIPKSSSLASAEAKIMLLATRAASALPEGPSRQDSYNIESCNALIRALPATSSSTVSNLYNQLSARLGRAATAAELSKALNIYRDTIDKDIRLNGSSIESKFKNFLAKAKNNLSRKPFTSYSTMARKTSRAPTKILYAYNTTSFTPRPANIMQRRQLEPYERNYQPWQSNHNSGYYNNNSRNYVDNKPKIKNNKPPQPRGMNGKFTKTSVNVTNARRSCLLCGLNSHVAASCRMMRDDRGKTINLVPTRGTCGVCPVQFKNKLHHPASLCPYRAGGVLSKNGTKNYRKR